MLGHAFDVTTCLTGQPHLCWFVRHLVPPADAEGQEAQGFWDPLSEPTADRFARVLIIGNQIQFPRVATTSFAYTKLVYEKVIL
jgi:hypothetical protein